MLLLAALLLTAAGQVSAADGERILTGMYTSGYQDRPASLRAIFTPDGEGRWTVVFHFSHAGRRHAYRGIAAGDLTGGVLSGRVENESGGRTFTFRCEFRDGKFKGHHYEIAGGREHRTGTLTLRG